MLCTNCGATNSDGAQFCTSCGKPLHAVWQSPTSELVSAAAESEEIVYAGFWERFAALIVDSLVVTVGWLALAFVLGIGMGVAGASGNAKALESGMPLMILALYGLAFLLYAGYFVLMEAGERGATLGKRALKLRVVDASGGRIGKGRAIGRFAAHFLSNISFYIGYLIQPFTERKQALHDMVSGTLVVKTEKSSSSLALILAIIGGFLVLVVGIGILAAVAIPAYQGYLGKTNTHSAEVIGKLATKAVQDYAAKTGKVPATIAETGVHLPKLPTVSTIKVNAKGEVQVVFNARAGATLTGKALVFDPSRNASGKIVWKCSGPGIPANVLPADCR